MSRPPRIIVPAAMIGTIIEWYDAFLFSAGAQYIRGRTFIGFHINPRPHSPCPAPHA
ncbi:MAG: hypothetical protein QXL96_04300 [Ignisphaera sp.]